MLAAWLAAVLSHPDLTGAFVIAGKTAIIYLFLIVGLRLLGKRELGQMTIYDFVLVVVLANSVQNAMVGDDTTLGGGLVSALTLLLVNRALTFLLTHYSWLEIQLVGQPELIVRDGKFLEGNLQREGVSHEQVMAALREHGIGKLADAQICMLEVDGTISVVPMGATIHRTRQHFRALRIQ